MNLEMLMAVVLVLLIAGFGLTAAVGWIRTADKLERAQERLERYIEAYRNEKSRCMLKAIELERRKEHD